MPDFQASRRGHRLWIPGSIVTLAGLGVLGLALQPELDRNYKTWAAVIVIAVALLLAFLWFLFLSRFRWRTRLITTGILTLLAFAAKTAVRVDGSTDARGLPKFVPRWASQRQALPANQKLQLPSDALASKIGDADPPDVPSFFGPNRTGEVSHVRLARDWNATPPRLLWRQPIGLGWSSFSSTRGRIYTQEQRGEQELVTCYDLLSGRLLWSHANPVRFTEWQGGDGPRSTPTLSHGKVFALGATGILKSLDAASGEVIWSRDVLKENQLPNLTWGMSCSPLVFDDLVVVTGGAAHGPTVLAYDRHTGAPRWKAGTDKASYSSPVLATLTGRAVVLSANAATLTAHDPASGRVVLQYPWTDDKRPKAAQPAVLDGDRVFLSAGYGMGCVMLQVTAVRDGELTARPLWKNLRMKTQFNSVSVHDGFLYGLDDGLLACVEAATGERKWKSGRYGSGQSLLVDDLLLVQSERGPVFLASANPSGFAEFGSIAALSSKTWNHPTLVGRYLLVRNDQEAACYELTVHQPTNQESASR